MKDYGISDIPYSPPSELNINCPLIRGNNFNNKYPYESYNRCKAPDHFPPNDPFNNFINPNDPYNHADSYIFNGHSTTNMNFFSKPQLPNDCMYFYKYPPLPKSHWQNLPPNITLYADEAVNNYLKENNCSNIRASFNSANPFAEDDWDININKPTAFYSEAANFHNQRIKPKNNFPRTGTFSYCDFFGSEITEEKLVFTKSAYIRYNPSSEDKQWISDKQTEYLSNLSNPTH